MPLAIRKLLEDGSGKVYVLCSPSLKLYASNKTLKSERKITPQSSEQKDGHEPQATNYETHICQILWKVDQNRGGGWVDFPYSRHHCPERSIQWPFDKINENQRDKQP